MLSGKGGMRQTEGQRGVMPNKVRSSNSTWRLEGQRSNDRNTCTQKPISELNNSMARMTRKAEGTA